MTGTEFQAKPAATILIMVRSLVGFVAYEMGVSHTKNALASGIKTILVFVIGFVGVAAMPFVAFLVGRMKVDAAVGAVYVP